MAYDESVLPLPATRQDVANLAIDVALALKSIQISLLRIRNNNLDEVDDDLKNIEDSAESVMQQFRQLTGWTADAT